MFCSNCGHNTADASGQNTFCPNCGSPIEQLQPNTAIPNATVPGVPGAPAVKPIVSRNHVIIGGGVLLAIIAAIVILVFVLGRSPFVGTWASESSSDFRIEFTRNGKGTMFEWRDIYHIEWSTETIGGMDVLIISMTDPFDPWWTDMERFEYRFFGNDNFLELREIGGWGGWETLRRVN